MRNKAIATGLAIGAGMFANTAPAEAHTGGVKPESQPPAASMPGGIPAEKTSPTPGLAAKIRYIKRNVQKGTPFQFLTLDPEAVYPNAEDTAVVVSSEGAEIVNPIAVLSDEGARIARYVGRKSETSIGMIPAGKAEVEAYIGNRVLDVDNPLEFITPHTLQNAPSSKQGATGFTAENGAGFGQMP